MTRIVSVDPGGAHVGWCEAQVDGESVKIDRIVEMTPQGAMHAAERMFPVSSVVVIEKFTLYPDKAKMLVGSEMETSQLIGVLKYLARKYRCKLVMQPASIKIPTESLMRHRGVRHTAVTQRVGGHAKDAETHLYHYLMR